MSSCIADNAVVRIEDERLDGLFRVVLDAPNYDLTVLVRLTVAAPSSQHACDTQSSTGKRCKKSPSIATPLLWEDRQSLVDLENSAKLTTIGVEPEARLLSLAEDLTDGDRARWERRLRVMEEFLNPRIFRDLLICHHGISGLVRRAVLRTRCSRGVIYSNFSHLCQYGFSAGSLITRNDRCGAPGVRRRCDGNRKKAGRKTNSERRDLEEIPQPGMSSAWVVLIMAAYRKLPKPKPKGKDRYDRIILGGFVSQYVSTPDGLVPQLPPQGTIPNKRQVDRVIQCEVNNLDRVRDKTIKGYFLRSMRGLHGRSWQGVAGPGHVFAIDSTTGDIHLRSSVNRAWFIGRPIVYIVVDVWSTAIVGFYVCLTGPAWSTAKIALFSTFASPELIGSLWGYEPLPSLHPLPGLPAEFLFDRGEYHSLGARETASLLGFTPNYAASYRPDWKGLVEVLFRITKDKQYFQPGAIDARRKEYELKGTKTRPAYTLREYVQYLSVVFDHYNLTADRSHRMDAHMIGAGVHPSPAGLWRYGFEAGIGYRKAFSDSHLIASLLPSETCRVKRTGIFLGALEYESEVATKDQWTSVAANYGSQERRVYTFPGSTSRIWTPNKGGTGMLDLTLSDQSLASADLTFDEYVEARLIHTLSNAAREYERTRQSIKALQRTLEMARDAARRTAEAEAQYDGPIPPMTEARGLEVFRASGTAEKPSLPTELSTASGDEAYFETMRKLRQAVSPENTEC